MPFIIVPFTRNGIPQTGLSPTIDIHRMSDDALIVSAGVMLEVALGIYKFNFSLGLGFDPLQDFAFRADAGVTLGPARYVYGSSPLHQDEISDKVWDETNADHPIPGSMGDNLRRVLAFASQDNVMLDGGPNATNPQFPDYDTKGLLINGRMRAFDTPTNRQNATPGSVIVETGELYRQIIQATATIQGFADSYSSDRDL